MTTISEMQATTPGAPDCVLMPSTNEFSAMLDALPQLAWMTDAEGAITWYNQRWYDYTGLGIEDMRGWGWRSVHHPDHLEHVERTFRSALLRGEAWEDTFPLRRHDGEYRWFLSRAQPMRDADGRVVHWFGTNTDITERRERDAELYRSERRFRSLVSAVAAIVWNTPASGEMETEQPAWSAYTGQSFEQIRGWGWLDAVHPDDRARTAEVWSRAVEAVEPYSVEHRVRRYCGSYRWMLVRAAPVLNARGELREWIGIHADIEERKRKDQELADARDAAEAANRAKSQFIANMSHELRTPLSAVIGYSEMLEEEVEDLGEKHLLTDLRKINANARHLLALISDVLDLSKIEANRMTVYAETFDVAELMSGVASTVDSLVRKRDNELVVEARNVLGTMHSDSTKLRQCLFNLLGNAAKFTEKGRIGVSAERVAEAGQDWLVFRVSDSGIGMNPEQLGRLFERFSQADESTTRKFGGTGLGLAITRGFAELMGGTIAVESEEGRGTTFTLRLPALYEEPATALAGPAPTGLEAGGDLVLVVDDDPAVRELISRFLHREGFQVRVTGDGRSGLALARLLKPRVILLDVMMPQMDGWSVLSTIREDQELAGTPVVMISFVNEPNLAQSLGASDYLTKPVEWEQLHAVMDRYRTCGQECGEILVIDDDAGSRERLEAILGRQGLPVRTAANGVEGLRAVERSRPSLILLDLMMPEMDGFTFLERLRAEPAWGDIPVVVLTAKQIDAEDRRRLDGKANRLVSKGSMDLRTLVGQLRTLIPTPQEAGHAG